MTSNHKTAIKLDEFLSSTSTTPYNTILTNIATHQRERKAADDEAARKLKDKMIVEYRNQSEQHEKLTMEFVGRVQDGLRALAATLLCQNANIREELSVIYQGTINNYILCHLGVYQKAVKKHKLNSRQRSDRFGGKSLARYKETLEKDESDLLDLFRKLNNAYEKTFLGRTSDAIVDPKVSLSKSDCVKVQHAFEPEKDYRGEREKSDGRHDSDFELDGFCASSCGSICSGPALVSRAKRKLNCIEGV